jgi:hypothetical protein
MICLSASCLLEAEAIWMQMSVCYSSKKEFDVLVGRIELEACRFAAQSAAGPIYAFC